MAAPIPAGLKPADISRFTQRAAQLEKAKPIVAYWCQYHIISQILGKGLHSTDQECMTFTMSTMDKLEQFKSQHANEPAVTDDVAGKAYIEQFGLETFSRADNAVRANKATRQTAETFSAAATFLDLLHIWGELDPEIAAKSKYAKYHALRIAKAIKAGEDPNQSNPTPEPAQQDILPALDPNDAEVKALEAGVLKTTQPPTTGGGAGLETPPSSLLISSDPAAPVAPTGRPRQPSVVEVPDEADRIQQRLARQSSINESLHPSREPSLPRPPANDVSPIDTQDAAAFYTNKDGQRDVSPIELPGAPKQHPTTGGNYFPDAPDSKKDDDDDDFGGLDLPSAPSGTQSSVFDGLNLPSAPSEPSIPPAPITFSKPSPPLGPRRASKDNSLPSPGIGQHQPPLPPSSSQSPPTQPPMNPRQPPSSIPPPQKTNPMNPQSPPPPPQPSHTVPINPPPVTYPTTSSRTIPTPFSTAPPPPPVAAYVPPANVAVDEESVIKAQKHARWAISALNFEDIPTAVRELQGALQCLGAGP